jgi:hypothetical protein
MSSSQLSLWLALVLLRLLLGRTAGVLVTLGYEDDEADEAVIPGGMRWVVGDVGDRWRTPGEEEYPPGSRGDSEYECGGGARWLPLSEGAFIATGEVTG